MPTPRHAVHRPPGPREPVDPARIGRRVVRRRATGVTADAVAAAREADLREQARIEAHADELQALRELGTLAQAEPRAGDEAVRDLLTRRAGGYVQADSTAGSRTPWPPAAATTPTWSRSSPAAGAGVTLTEGERYTDRRA